MGLENLRSIFKAGFDEQTEDFESNSPDTNSTNLFDSPPQPTQFIATNPTDFSTANGNNNLAYTPLTFTDGASTFFNNPPGPTQFIATNPTDFSTANGNNDSPYTTLTSLGGQFEGNLSWENLYNSNHTPKDDASYKGLTPISYGVNVNRDNLNIRNPEDGRFGFGGSRRTSVISAIGKLIEQVPGLGGDFTEFLKDTGKEPYIVSSIGKGGRRINSNFFGRGFPIERSITDTARIAKFLTSPDGVLFAEKQKLLVGKVPKMFGLKKALKIKDFETQKYKSNFTSTSLLLTTLGRAGGGPASLLDRTQPNFGDVISFVKGDGEDTDAYPPSGLKKLRYTFLGNGEPSEYGEGGTYYPKDSGDKHTLLDFGKADSNLTTPNRTQYLDKIEDAHETDFGNGTIDESQNGMPFYFKDMRDGAFVFFRAYLEGLSENISPNYNPTQYIGRSEPVYTYGQTERDINFTLKLFAQTSKELQSIYKKMNRLTSLCYPEYYKDTFKVADPASGATSGTAANVQYTEKSYGNRMKPPLTKLRIGELYGTNNNELMGYIKSLSYNVDETAPYETKKGKRVPKYVIATIGYQVIHSSVPNLETKFYGYIGD